MPGQIESTRCKSVAKESYVSKEAALHTITLFISSVGTGLIVFAPSRGVCSMLYSEFRLQLANGLSLSRTRVRRLEVQCIAIKIVAIVPFIHRI
jgi:hypothetical protein